MHIKTIVVTFLLTKSHTLYITRFFMKFLKLAFYVFKNYDTLRYVTFLYTKIHSLRKRKDNLRYIFMIQKAWHFALRDFSWNFLKLAEGLFLFLTKNNGLCVEYLYAKNNAISVKFLYTKSLTLCVTFLYPKNDALCITFLYPKCVTSHILIPNFKRTYDQRDQRDK